MWKSARNWCAALLLLLLLPLAATLLIVWRRSPTPDVPRSAANVSAAAVHTLPQAQDSSDVKRAGADVTTEDSANKSARESDISLAEAILASPPPEPGGLLPTRADDSGAELLTGQLSTSVIGMERDAGRRGELATGGVRTEVFGLAATGSKFVYVFDRSGSMDGPGFSLLDAAKAELLESLEALGELQQFQIIFYNDHPTLMQLAAHPDGLVFATDVNKKVARQFMSRITAGGGTQHEVALDAALRMRPDVIYFLTDADEPPLSPEQLQAIRRLNDERTAIHAIQFGEGPASGEPNFISELATQNSGEYRYVDTKGLAER